MEKKVCMWVKQDDCYTPSEKINIVYKLPEGIYRAKYDNTRGYCCTPYYFEGNSVRIFESLIADIDSEIENFLSKDREYVKNGLCHTYCMFLTGAAGTGKTSILGSVSRDFVSKGGTVFVVDHDNLPTYLDFMQYGFREIDEDTPILTVFDDIDSSTSDQDTVLELLSGEAHRFRHIILASCKETESVPKSYLNHQNTGVKFRIGNLSEDDKRKFFESKGVGKEELENLLKVSPWYYTIADLNKLYVYCHILGHSSEKAAELISTPMPIKYFFSPNTFSPADNYFDGTITV